VHVRKGRFDGLSIETIDCSYFLDMHCTRSNQSRASRKASMAPESRFRPSPVSSELKHMREDTDVQRRVEKFGVNMTKLTEEQAAYIGVTVEGPYKPGHYRD